MPQDPRLIDKEAREAWRTAPLPDLVLHIVERYHLEARLEMARLESYAEEAALLHGFSNPVLQEVRHEVARLGTEMRAHITYEEREVFPAILKLAHGAAVGQVAGMPEPMLKRLMDEHEAEAGQVRRLRALTEALSEFEDHRGIHLKLQAALKTLAEDLQQHLFLENQILFRRTC